VTRRPSLVLEALEGRLTPSFAWDGVVYSNPPPAVVGGPPLPLLAECTSDGILDEISVNYSTWQMIGIEVRPGRGDGTFGNPKTSWIYAPNSGSVMLTDVNADGRLDAFVVVNGYNWDPPRGETRLGWGDGIFRQADTYPLDFYPFQRVGVMGTVHNWGTGRTDVVIEGGSDEGYLSGPWAVLVNNGDWESPPPPPPTGPSLSIGDAGVTEGNAGQITATFAVTLSAASTETVTVDYTAADGTATGSDYAAAAGTLTFAPGEMSKAVTVLVNGDRLGEPNETFVVDLSTPTNATIADAQGVGTIGDDEPRVSISDVSKTEGKKGQTTLFTFTVTLSAAYDQPVTMSFRTVNGTATTSNGDYVAKSGTLTFGPGQTSKTMTFEVKGDSKREANETFYLDLFGLSNNALFTKNRGIGTILNDD
jgi:hypothetical protein